MGSAVAFAAVLAAALAAGPQAQGLSGTIRAADGAPIAGAAIVVRQPGGAEASATSDAAGAFALADVVLPAVVEVSARGFARSARLVERSPADFTLTPASVRESVIVTAPADTEGIWRDGVTGQTRLSRDDLERQPAVTVDESLRLVAGFSLFRRSSARASNPTSQGVTLRGLSASGASRGLVLFDGVPLNEGFGGWVTWTRVPLEAIAVVEVTRGAEGDVYGSDALGGVISIRSRRGAPGLIGVTGEGGSHGLGSAAASAGLKRGRGGAFGAGGWLTNDGVIPLESASRGAVDRPASADWANGFGRLDAAWATRRLSVTAWGGREERGNGTAAQWNKMRGGTMAVAFDALVGSTLVAARVSTGPNAFDQTFSAVAAGRATETLTSTQHIDTTTTRALVEAGRGIPRGYLVGRASMSRATSDFVVTTTSATTTRALRDDAEAVSVHAGFTPRSRLTVGAGLRHEWRASPDAAAARRSATVGHVSGAWTVADPLVLRGSFATSHRWPTLNELVRDFRVGNVLTVPNPALRPERARSGEASASVGRSRWRATAAGFWTIVDDAVANVTQPSTTGILRQRQNAGEAHASGFELDAEARPIARLRLRASVSIVDARFRQSLEPALEGNRLPQVPRATVSFFTDASLPWNVTASLFVRTAGEQFDDDRNQFRLARATQADLRLAGRLGPGRHFGWHVAVENALDARIEIGRTPLVTLAPGRVVRAGLSWRK